MAEPQFISRNLALKEFDLKDTPDKKLATFQNNCGKFSSIISKGKAKLSLIKYIQPNNQPVI